MTHRIQQVSKDVRSLRKGSLYTGWHHMERAGWFAPPLGTSENNPCGRHYRLLPNGRMQLAEEGKNWKRRKDADVSILQRA